MSDDYKTLCIQEGCEEKYYQDKIKELEALVAKLESEPRTFTDTLGVIFKQKKQITTLREALENIKSITKEDVDRMPIGYWVEKAVLESEVALKECFGDNDE